jgi:Flp pilus assembly protein TadG
MSNIVKKFLKNQNGNFAIIFGLTLAPIAMSMGLAADYSAFQRMDSRVQFATEAAMLAASKHMNYVREQDYAYDGKYDLTNAQLVAEVDKVFKPFFEANFSAGGYELKPDQYTLEYIEADNNTKVLVTMKYDTAVMSAFGKDTMYSSREMIINLKVQPNNYVIDIVMCIDATGSMQNTLNAVKASAMTFNQNLREELGVGPDSTKIKIRVRPMFYRDWEEGRTYQTAMVAYNAAYETYLEDYNEWATGGEESVTGTNWEDLRSNLQSSWNSSSWYFLNGKNWKKSTSKSHPKTHKRVKYEGNWYYFESIADLNAMVDSEKAADTVFIKPETGTPPTPPTKPINHALNDYGDFIDLDPTSFATTGDTKADQNAKFTNFLGSTHAFGGADLPEAAGACLNEAIRSNWYDTQSTDSKTYFKIPNGDKIVSELDDIPAGTYTKVTNIPVVVFWSDAAINSLQKSRDYISPTTPTSYTTFQSLWNDVRPTSETPNPNYSPSGSGGTSKYDLIDKRYRMMIHFGPYNISGFSTLYGWDKVFYGGSLSTGNSQAVKVIAKKILETVPDLLRVGS